MTKGFNNMSGSEIENWVDIGLRHKADSAPKDYLKQWLKIARIFAYTTYDDSWGEFEKAFAIIIRRLVEAERSLDRIKQIVSDDD